MPVRIYRMTSTAVTTSVGQATTTVVAKGRIKQVVLGQVLHGGANPGRVAFEVALNNTANGNAETATGAPSELLVARLANSAPGNGAVSNSLVVPCDIAVIPGNLLCINVLQAVGTAPSSGANYADVHVME